MPNLARTLRSFALASFALWCLDAAVGVLLRGLVPDSLTARALAASWAEFGTLTIALFFLAYAAAAWLGRANGTRASFLRAFVVVWGPTAWVTHALTQGRWIRRFLPNLASGLAIATLVALLGAWLLTAYLTHLEPLLRRRPREGSALIAGAVLVVWALDRALFPALYFPFHASCAALALLGAQRLFALRTSEDGTIERWAPVGLLATAAVLSVLWPQRLRPIENARIAEMGGLVRTSQELVARASHLGRTLEARSLTTPPLDLPNFAGDAEDIDVLLITVDGLNPWIVLGDGERGPGAPFLARLAREGVSLARVYTPYPATEAALASLLSAQAHHETADGPQGTRAVVLEYYRRRGYLLYCDVPFWDRIQHRLAAPACDSELVSVTKRGACGPGENDCGFNMDLLPSERRLALLQAFLELRQEPVFAFVHLLSTHAPYESGPHPADYAGALAYTDELLRSFVQKLEQRGRPFLLVIGSDHGHALGWHGIEGHNSSLFEDQVRVPWIVWSHALPAKSVTGPVSLLDLSKALTAPNAHAMLDWLTNRAASNAPILLRHENAFAMVQGNFKLIAHPLLSSEALYDVEHDPTEAQNLLIERPELALSLRALVEASRR